MRTCAAAHQQEAAVFMYQDHCLLQFALHILASRGLRAHGCQQTSFAKSSSWCAHSLRGIFLTQWTVDAWHQGRGSCDLKQNTRAHARVLCILLSYRIISYILAIAKKLAARRAACGTPGTYYVIPGRIYTHSSTLWFRYLKSAKNNDSRFIVQVPVY